MRLKGSLTGQWSRARDPATRPKWQQRAPATAPTSTGLQHYKPPLVSALQRAPCQVIDRSFGFDTAVEEAQRAINSAHVEAESTSRGVGLVKLMGRNCGQIAMHATLASRDVDCCLIPEVRGDHYGRWRGSRGRVGGKV